MKKFQLFLFVSLFILGVLVMANASFAICCCGDEPTIPPGEISCTDYSSMCKEVEGTSCTDTSSSAANTGKGVTLTDPLGIHEKAPGQEFQYLIGKIIYAVMGLVGSIALLMFVYGGFLWMTAMGSEDKITKGKNIFIWSVAGLAVIFTSYMLVHFVLTSLIQTAG